MIVRVVITAVFLVILTTTLVSGISEFNNPLYDKYKGILSEWHKARICMPCHINTLSGRDLDRFLSCTPCHNENLNIKSPKAIEKVHGVNVCIKCHVGSQYSAKNLGLNVHTPHKAKACSTCHGGDGAISKPDKSLCTDCHGSNPHAVHSQILDRICFDCHSETMKDYLPEIKKEELTKALPAATPTPAPQEKTVSFKSLSDLILWIINLLF